MKAEGPPQMRISAEGTEGTGSEVGPLGWENWRAMLTGLPQRGGLEIACYTDARTIGASAEFGPYLLLPPIVDDFDLSLRSLAGAARMGLVLRMDRYRQTDDPDLYVDHDWEQSLGDIFHGGDAGEELASLVSLALGIRLRAKGISRSFDPDGDPGGYPHEFD